jgi:hypothetical protein
MAYADGIWGFPEDEKNDGAPLQVLLDGGERLDYRFIT